jgi:hypothetical protein
MERGVQKQTIISKGLLLAAIMILLFVIWWGEFSGAVSSQ